MYAFENNKSATDCREEFDLMAEAKKKKNAANSCHKQCDGWSKKKKTAANCHEQFDG